MARSAVFVPASIACRSLIVCSLSSTPSITALTTVSRVSSECSTEITLLVWIRMAGATQLDRSTSESFFSTHRFEQISRVRSRLHHWRFIELRSPTIRVHNDLLIGHAVVDHVDDGKRRGAGFISHTAEGTPSQQDRSMRLTSAMPAHNRPRLVDERHDSMLLHPAPVSRATGRAVRAERRRSRHCDDTPQDLS